MIHLVCLSLFRKGPHSAGHQLGCFLNCRGLQVYVSHSSHAMFVSFQLFDYIAEHLAKFTSQHDLCDMHVPLGFTFSFPCFHKGLASGKKKPHPNLASPPSDLGRGTRDRQKIGITYRGPYKTLIPLLP